jgi:hypothetical protein
MRAQTPEDVLESRIWKDACQRLEARLLREWECTDPADVDQLQKVAFRRHAYAEFVREMTRELKEKSLSR